MADSALRRGGARAALADAGALLVFVVVGLLSHHGAVGPSGLARDGLPLLGGWFAAALAWRLYTRPSPRRLLPTWACGIGAGVLVRALVLGRTLNGREAAFLGTALAFTLLFVLVARALVAWGGSLRGGAHDALPARRR